jgi:cold shock CspA family protein
LTGTIIKKFESFGFLKDVETGRELFFHAGSTDTPFDRLVNGDVCEYKMGTNAKGPIAIDVAKVQQ